MPLYSIRFAHNQADFVARITTLWQPLFVSGLCKLALPVLSLNIFYGAQTVTR